MLDEWNLLLLGWGYNVMAPPAIKLTGSYANANGGIYA
ncbi:hypothetical protein QFZ80_007318 [Paenibacillus sp. V4I7]|nr:hypothetical protein [Paenibacillus sp. V4I7]MDQ0918032.1 hypothetical protein [Paenibacillus sp. V4I5]